MTPRLFRTALISSAALAAAVALPASAAASAQPTETFSLTDVLDFTPALNPNVSASPQANLIQAADGNFYGTTRFGGVYGNGTIFQFTPAGGYTLLYSFQGTDDGGNPLAGLIQGLDGALYGTASGLNTNTGGAVFKITTAGQFTLLYTFGSSPTDLANPEGALVQGTDGNFYGNTFNGGQNQVGGVFVMTPQGDITSVLSFDDLLEVDEVGSLLQGTDGNFYGTTYVGGDDGFGGLFQLTPGGSINLLETFYSNGAFPQAGVIQGTDGFLYGSTVVGANGGFPYDPGGTLFRILPDGDDFTSLYNIGTNTSDSNPNGLLLGSDGNLYGTNHTSSNPIGGGLFQFNPVTGVYTDLAYFTTDLNADPNVDPNDILGGSSASVIQGYDGNFYATTTNGNNGNGSIYQLSASPALPAPVQLSVSPSGPLLPGQPVSINYAVLNAPTPGVSNGTLNQCELYIDGNPVGLLTGTPVSATYALTPAQQQLLTAGTHTLGLNCGGTESAAPVSLNIAAPVTQTTTLIDTSLTVPVFGQTINFQVTSPDGAQFIVGSGVFNPAVEGLGFLNGPGYSQVFALTNGTTGSDVFNTFTLAAPGAYSFTYLFANANGTSGDQVAFSATVTPLP